MTGKRALELANKAIVSSGVVLTNDHMAPCIADAILRACWEQREEDARKTMDKPEKIKPVTFDIEGLLFGGYTKQNGDRLISEVERLRASKDNAYAERNKLVRFVAQLFPSHLARHPESDKEWDNDWRWIVCIHSPKGQLTWHLHDSHLQWFDFWLEKGANHWDGHTTEDKYQRLAECGYVPGLEDLQAKLEKARGAFNDLVALEKTPGTIANAFDAAMDIARKALAELEEK